MTLAHIGGLPVEEVLAAIPAAGAALAAWRAGIAVKLGAWASKERRAVETDAPAARPRSLEGCRSQTR